MAAAALLAVLDPDADPELRFDGALWIVDTLTRICGAVGGFSGR